MTPLSPGLGCSRSSWRFLLQPAGAADKPDPAADAKAFRDYFVKKFPNVKLEEFVNGPYALNEDMRRQWEEKEQFPPYEFSLEMGKELFAKAFQNGRRYADCFPHQGIGIRQNYPYFDEAEGKVVTLELALNRCREANGEPPVSYVGDEMAALTAYMAFTSRGKPFEIRFPTIHARSRPTRTASAISIRGAASSISPAQPATCRTPANACAPKCWHPRSGS